MGAFGPLYDLHQLLVTDAGLRESLHTAEGHSEDQLNQVYCFAVLKCNNWIAVEAAYLDRRLDSSLYEAVKTDVKVTIDMWPVIQDAIRQWRTRYPEVANGPIFSGLA